MLVWVERGGGVRETGELGPKGLAVTAAHREASMALRTFRFQRMGTSDMVSVPPAMQMLAAPIAIMPMQVATA